MWTGLKSSKASLRALTVGKARSYWRGGGDCVVVAYENFVANYCAACEFRVRRMFFAPGTGNAGRWWRIYGAMMPMVGQRDAMCGVKRGNGGQYGDSRAGDCAKNMQKWTKILRPQ